MDKIYLVSISSTNFEDESYPEILTACTDASVAAIEAARYNATHNDGIALVSTIDLDKRSILDMGLSDDEHVSVRVDARILIRTKTFKDKKAEDLTMNDLMSTYLEPKYMITKDGDDQPVVITVSSPLSIIRYDVTVYYSQEEYNRRTDLDIKNEIFEIVKKDLIGRE